MMFYPEESEEDIYTEEGTEEALESDSITYSEEWFMKGYRGAI